MMKRINNYLKSISKISSSDLSIDFIYKELVCHENRNTNGCIKDILRIFTDLNDTNRRRVKLSGDSIILSNMDDVNFIKKKVELGIFFRLDNVSFCIDNLLEFFDKKKIIYNGKFDVYDNVGYLCINLIDTDDSLKVIDYVNSKLKDYVYSANPLFYSVDNVMVSISCEYSYIELLSMYLYDFIIQMNELKKDIDDVSFKNFILNKYFKLNNQVDMYQFLKYNVRNIKLSLFFSNLDEITSLMLYLFNGNDFDEFKDYFRKLNRKNSKVTSKYLIYDNFDDCVSLLEELVRVMYFNYGEVYARDSIVNYRNTGYVDYITRKCNLRKKVMNSKKFMIYLYNISLGEELDRIIVCVGFDIKKKILEDVCKETYRISWAVSNKNYAKIQVARGLIRMECGDYSFITRSNDARKKAIDNIRSYEVIKLLKGTLNIDYVKKEEELYELYADYIENLCTE